MEPLIATKDWGSYTPDSAELIQNRIPGSAVQIVQGTLSETVDPSVGPLVQYQGTVLRYGESMRVLDGVAVNYRTLDRRCLIGRNPA